MIYIYRSLLNFPYSLSNFLKIFCALKFCIKSWCQSFLSNDFHLHFGSDSSAFLCISLVCVNLMRYLRLGNFVKKKSLFISHEWRQKDKVPYCFSLERTSGCLASQEGASEGERPYLHRKLTVMQSSDLDFCKNLFIQKLSQ